MLIALSDEVKTTMLTKNESYEYLVMDFSLTNTPATFCNLMSNVLVEYMDVFIVMYLDDIVVYSLTLDDHVEYLHKVLARLRESELYV